MHSSLPPKKPFTAGSAIAYAVFALLLVLSYWSASSVEFSWSRLLEGLPFMADFLGRMWPPDLSILGKVWADTLVTIQIAWVSTVIAALISLPIGFLAAANLFANRPIR